MKNKYTARLLFVLLVMALTACGGGGGGGGGSSSTPNNLSAKSISIVTADPKIAYPLQVSVNMTQPFSVSTFHLFLSRSLN